jgi:hypothetical protein
MKSAIVTVLGVAGFAIWTPGHAQTQTVPVVFTSDYYAQPKVLVVHALNTSGKDITGYIFLIRHKNADGTVDKGWSSAMSDMLSMLITAQMAKDGAASERIRQQESADNFSASTGTGIFLAGETRDMTLTETNSGSENEITAGAVFYADGSYDQQDEDAFKLMLANRQHQLQQMKDTDELIRNALADQANADPVAVVLTQLNRRRVEEMAQPGQQFPVDVSEDSELRSMQQPISYGPMKGKTERERLTQYVEEQEKKIQLMTPHCHLEIVLKAAAPDSAK